jgi:hypothetical protein
MKSEAERDGQTVTIATTLALLVVVMMVGVAVQWFLSMTSHPSPDAQRSIFITTLAAGLLTSGRYLLRHRLSANRAPTCWPRRSAYPAPSPTEDPRSIS